MIRNQIAMIIVSSTYFATWLKYASCAASNAACWATASGLPQLQCAELAVNCFLHFGWYCHIGPLLQTNQILGFALRATHDCSLLLFAALSAIHHVQMKRCLPLCRCLPFSHGFGLQCCRKYNQVKKMIFSDAFLHFTLPSWLVGGPGASGSLDGLRAINLCRFRVMFSGFQIVRHLQFQVR